MQRTHGSDALEVLVEGGVAHIYGLCKLFNDKGLIVLLSDHLDSLSNPVRMAADDGELMQVGALVALKNAIQNFADQERGQNRDILWRIE